MLISKALKEGDNSIIRNLTLTACATKLYDRIKDFPEELIKKKFSFEKENIIHAYVHSSVISPNKAFNRKCCFEEKSYHSISSGIKPNDIFCNGDSSDRSKFNKTS